ncbi:MAG: ketoacyl-ACP synthase III [Nitrospirae bacterium]|nr:MAG: ketoacyl-ACP synthase III [Nitrospirota bacterium]
MNSQILGTGSYVPDQVLTNAELERMVETSDVWIRERTGIRERRIAKSGQPCSDLATRAGRQALAAAKLSASDLDLILVATCTGDSPLPATACLVQHHLGATRAAACDVGAACCGFLYALTIADAYVRTGARAVLVIGAEVMSVITDWTDRNTCVLFGDGAGAVVVGPTNDDVGIQAVRLHANGQLAHVIEVPGGGSRYPASEHIIQNKLPYIKMRGNETFKIAVKTMEEAVREVLAVTNVSIEQIDLFIPHQANIRILQAVGQRLGLPMNKTVINLDRLGNTSAASIPLAIDEAVRNGRIRKGMRVLIAAFGAGLTWGAGLIRW